MAMDSLKIGGAVVFWAAAQTRREQLLSAWGSLDSESLDYESLVPEPRTALAILRSTLGSLYFGGHDIRPLGKTGYAVHRWCPSPDGERVVYSFERSIKLVKEGETLRLAVSPHDEGVSRAVQGAYDLEADVLTATALGTALVKVVEGLRGVPLRPGGCIYWLPDEALPAWSALAHATACCGIGKAPRIYTIRHRLDADSVRAVADAATAELRRAAEALEAEVQAGGLGKKALDNRKSAANDLLELAELYEGILGQALGAAREAIAEAGQTVASAALLEMAAVEA